MQSKPNVFERLLESAIFSSRWLLAPFFDAGVLRQRHAVA
jgi:uncharacterized membrane protein YqhA